MIELNYKESGVGEPVIILHGLFGMLDNWHTIAKRMSKEFWVITVDQRNHGRSPHSDEFNYSVLVEDIVHLLESKFIPRAHFIGHSMGGKTVVQLAVDFPELLDKMIVVDIVPNHVISGHIEIFNTVLELDLTRISTRKQAEEALMQVLDDSVVVQFLLKNLTRDKSGTYSWKANFQSLSDNYSEITRVIEIPDVIDTETLFIGGDRSPYITESAWEATKANFSNARLKYVSDSGHWVHADQPDEFYTLVMDFLIS